MLHHLSKETAHLCQQRPPGRPSCTLAPKTFRRAKSFSQVTGDQLPRQTSFPGSLAHIKFRRLCSTGQQVRPYSYQSPAHSPVWAWVALLSPPQPSRHGSGSRTRLSQVSAEWVSVARVINEKQALKQPKQHYWCSRVRPIEPKIKTSVYRKPCFL